VTPAHAGFGSQNDISSRSYGIEASAPVGYDTLVVTVRLSTPSGGLGDEDTFNLPIASAGSAEFDNAANVLKTTADLPNATFGGEALFHDEEGALPDRAVGIGSVPITASPCP
jgi:hypothetical protein